MKERKYTNITVSSEVYVDSSIGYHFRVFARVWSKGRARWVYQTGFGWEDFPGAPDYVTREVRLKVLETLKNPSTVFHEYDQERTKRYKNLRYHDQASLTSQIQDMSLHIARRMKPEQWPTSNQAVLPLGAYDAAWGAPAWFSLNLVCPGCGQDLSDERKGSLTYYLAPVAISSRYCHDCEGNAVCLLDDQLKLVETYFVDQWDLQAWPLYYDQ